MSDCSANTLIRHIDRLYTAMVVGSVVFTICTMMIVALLVHYGNAMRNTSLLESFLIQAKDSDTHMRQMAGDIRHRAVALQTRLADEGDEFSSSELQHIIMVADRVNNYPYFWIMQDSDPQDGGGS